MRVKVNGTWYSPDTSSIMIELTDEDKKAIIDMPKKYCRYATLPNGTPAQKAIEFMEITDPREREEFQWPW